MLSTCTIASWSEPCDDTRFHSKYDFLHPCTMLHNLNGMLLRTIGKVGNFHLMVAMANQIAAYAKHAASQIVQMVQQMQMSQIRPGSPVVSE